MSANLYSLIVHYDHDGEVLVLSGSETAMALIKEALVDVLGITNASGDVHAHATFFAEGEKLIYGVTDDAKGCVGTRDGEQPIAIINLFACK